eukprot:9322939-Pyramimonas_sp.AAC.1
MPTTYYTLKGQVQGAETTVGELIRATFQQGPEGQHGEEIENNTEVLPLPFPLVAPTSLSCK